MTFTSEEVRSYYSTRCPKAKLSGREFRFPCPVHQGKRDSFSVNAETGLAQCYSECAKGWDMISLEMELSGLPFDKARDSVFEIVGRPRIPWEERDFISIYDYQDASGKSIYQVIRKTGKKFSQRRGDGSGGWIWNLKGTPQLPYRLPRLISSDFVAIVEGEKDVHSLESIGMTATCNSGGAMNFNESLAPYFAGKIVAIFPDNDDKGRQHALDVAKKIHGVAKSVKIVDMPKLPPKGDVTDFILSGKTLADLRELYRKASEWTEDWSFPSDLPDENAQYIRTFEQEIEAAGGINEFWNLSKLAGLETPWPRLSRALGGGLRRGEVYVVGGNQGSGKTSLGLQIAMAAILRDEGVLIYSMEMGWRAVFQRMASIHARVNLLDYRDAQITLLKKIITEAEKQSARNLCASHTSLLARATRDLVDRPFWVSTKALVTPEHIATETKKLRRDKPIKMVVVDHMQLMSSSGNQKSDYEKFTSISRTMKQVAMELEIPIVLISQTSRSQAKEHRGDIEVSDLRGSGALEEDAAAVLLLYEDKEDRDKALDESGDRYTKGPVRCWLKVGKNRYGEQGLYFPLIHSKYCTRFDYPEPAGA